MNEGPRKSILTPTFNSCCALLAGKIKATFKSIEAPEESNQFEQLPLFSNAEKWHKFEFIIFLLLCKLNSFMQLLCKFSSPIRALAADWSPLWLCWPSDGHNHFSR